MMRPLTRLLLVLTATSVLSGCKSFYQTADQAMYRATGKRLLNEAPDVGIPARLHWQYAWLAVASYNAIVDQPGQKEALPPSKRAGPTTIETPKGPVTCESPERELEKAKWTRFYPLWPDPVSDLGKRLKDTHTRVQVWENKLHKTVVVSFGGTESNNLFDWLSNLRWFLPDREDEYSIVTKEVTKEFVAEYKRRAALPEYAYLRNMKLRATGHSLGGGLAQQFAYALPVDPDNVVPKVTRVYAFDPSPVTGHDGVDAETRKSNEEHMKIDRVYERGEFLAGARAFTGLFLVPSKQKPEIRGVRYMFFWKSPLAFVSSHSMPQLACYLQDASHRQLPVGGQDEPD